MITYSFVNRGEDSLYIHLYKCLKQDILQKKLQPGEKLPSKRAFAKNLGVSTITVENAYAQLHAEGYIYSVPKSGFFVADMTTPYQQEEKEDTRDEKIEEPVSNQTDQIDFVSNHTNSENFPFSIWAKIMREVISEKSEELMISSPSAGILELRKAICKHLKAFRNMDVVPEQVFVGAGTEYLYSLLIQLLGREQVFALENPGYRKLAKIYASNGVAFRFIPVDEKGMQVGELEKTDVTIAHTTPSHHFPTGTVLPVSRRYELLAWAAQKKERYIIEDDYDSELRLEGKPIPTLQSMDIGGKVIYMNTFTKTLASTIRISYMVLPKKLMQLFHEKLYFYSCTVSNFEQYTLARFIAEGFYEKHINRMRNYYRKIRNELLAAIANSSISNKVTILEEKAGLHFLMRIDTKVPDEVLIQEGAKNGLALACLSQYYDEKSVQNASHVLLMNYAGISREKVAEAIALFEKTVHNCEKAMLISE